MANPYAPPQDSNHVRETSWKWSTTSQVVWLAVAGGVFATGMVAVEVLTMISDNQHMAMSLTGLALAFSIRAWFCRNLNELLIAAVALSWGLLGTLSILLIFVMRAGVDSTRLTIALVIVPACLTLVGWPVMAIGRGRRAEPSNPAGVATDESHDDQVR